MGTQGLLDVPLNPFLLHKGIKPKKKKKKSSKNFPGGSDGKAFVYNAGDLGLIPGSGSSLEKEMATHSSTLA